MSFGEDDSGSVKKRSLPCFPSNSFTSAVFCSSALLVCSRLSVRPQRTCSRARDRMIALSASLFDFMATPGRYPVLASASKCKYVFPSTSACEISLVGLDETASSGAYLLWLRLTKGILLALPTMQAPHENGPSSIQLARMLCSTSRYSR